MGRGTFRETRGSRRQVASRQVELIVTPPNTPRVKDGGFLFPIVRFVNSAAYVHPRWRSCDLVVPNEGICFRFVCFVGHIRSLTDSSCSRLEGPWSSSMRIEENKDVVELILGVACRLY